MTTMNLAETVKSARVISGQLFIADNVTCSEHKHNGGNSCLTKEGHRPRKGDAIRVFSDYNPEKLCLGCRAYWFAEMSAQTLERLRYIELQDAADKQFKGAALTA